MTYEEFLHVWHDESSVVEVKTSGSTGKPKLMLVEKERMKASARMTCEFLGLKPGDKALLCMSVDYIAGKMMVVRSEECGLQLHVVQPSGRPLEGLNSPFDFVAMVPSQVHDSLDNPLLRQTKNLIIGGGAIPDKLAAELKTFPNPVYSTYGMTETLSHIALRRLDGAAATDYYTPLPGVKVSLNDDGCLVIDAPRVCSIPLVTNDIAELKDGCFRILGRRDNVICSGGIKIQTEEVERILQPHLSSCFAISSCPDDKYGEAVVLFTESTDLEAVRQLCSNLLPRYWRPKHYRHLDRIPMTETGKIARHLLRGIR